MRLACLLAALFFSVTSVASERNFYNCTARDRGWEEHYGGHPSCFDCLRYHGRCVEVCEEEFYSCRASGVHRRGYPRTFEARGRDRWQAERRALERCYRRGYRNCHITFCDRVLETISRREC